MQKQNTFHHQIKVCNPVVADLIELVNNVSTHPATPASGVFMKLGLLLLFFLKALAILAAGLLFSRGSDGVLSEGLRWMIDFWRSLLV